MAECPYCASSVADDERYCPRCGERLGDLADREGIFDPEVLMYLDGVRNGARAFDPETELHQRFERQLSGAVADFAEVADFDVDLPAVLDLEELPAADARGIDDRQVLGLAALLGVIEESFPGPATDELRALYCEHVDSA